MTDAANNFGRDDVQLLDRTRVFDGYFRVDRYRLRHRLFAGGDSEVLQREVFERGHIVAVLLVDVEHDLLVLIEQFRPGAYAADWQPWLIECVAGIIESGETAKQVAVREAYEETGCQVDRLLPIHRFLSSPGACSETVTLLCGRTDATGVGGIHGIRDEGEDIRVRVIPVRDAVAALETGRIVNAKTIIALQWLTLNYDALKRRWLLDD